MSDHPTERLSRHQDDIVTAEKNSVTVACLPCAVAGGVAVVLAFLVAWALIGLAEIVWRFGAWI